jgi:hypothetical protein|tara:strand:+ start:844 stop:1275 length:432 start_codon:yes stop_codon:yes gene_type:complete
MIFFKKKRIELGEGHIEQYTIFESKRFGGIWLYNWQTIDQNRFHTHAFNSVALTLSGSYTQEIIKDGVIKEEVVSKRFIPRYLPKNYCHRILEAKPNTWTLVFFGRWIPYWWEYFADTKTWVKYSWGRKVIEKVKGDETTKLE